MEIPWRLPRPLEWWCPHLYSRSDGRLLGQNLFWRIADFWQLAERTDISFCTTSTVESFRQLARSGRLVTTDGYSSMIHSLFERRRKPRLRWCWLGCSFDFFYRGNIKDKVLTRLHPVSTGDLPRDLHTCVFQFFQFSGVAITNLNRIHLLAVNSVCGFEFKNPTCRFSSDGHCSDELTGYGYFFCMETGCPGAGWAVALASFIEETSRTRCSPSSTPCRRTIFPVTLTRVFSNFSNCSALR